MKTTKPLYGAAAITHNLKVYGNGHMEDGLKRLAIESEREGYHRGFQHAMEHINQIVQPLLQQRRR